jgi:two-component sensor histidine kinase
MHQLVSEFLDGRNSSEANHRIANHLALIASLLVLQKQALAKANSLSREDAEWILEDSVRRINTVARVHRLLANSDDRSCIDVRHYLQDVAQGIVASTAGHAKYRLQSVFDCGCLIGADHLASLGLLVGELVTNAVKYAHPTGVAGVIKLFCSAADDATIVRVSDDGVGLPEGFDPATSGGLGLRMIRSLVKQLQGEIAFDSTCLGLNVTIRIPNSEGLRRVVEFRQNAPQADALPKASSESIGEANHEA